jgi:hypothetical protein
MQATAGVGSHAGTAHTKKERSRSHGVSDDYRIQHSSSNTPADTAS